MIAGGTGKRFLDSSRTILTWESFDPRRAGASNSSLAVVVGMWHPILDLTLFLYNQRSGSLEAMGASLMRLGWAGFAQWFLNSRIFTSSLTLEIP